MVMVIDFCIGISGVGVVVFGVKVGESCGIFVVMVNVFIDEVDICFGFKYGRGIEIGIYRFCFIIEGIIVCMVVGIGYGYFGEEVKVIEFMFVICIDLNVGVVVIEFIVGRFGFVYDLGLCIGFIVNVM